MQRRAFTLIDLSFLLTAILILVPFLIPSLRQARSSAKLAVSISNLRQIAAASEAYRADFKDYSPILWTGSPGKPQGNPDDCTGLCPWSSWGKYNNGWWYAHGSTPVGSNDLYPADRPLNQYTYPGLVGQRPAQRVAADDPARDNLEMKLFLDPAETTGHQQAPPSPNGTGAGAPAINCYNDVGTSYIFNTKWYAQIESAMGDKPALMKIRFGLKRIQLAESYIPSRFCWAFDENPPLVANNPDPKSLLKNAYGDNNKGNIAFFDGHVAYTIVTPGGAAESFKNQQYSMVFEDLAVPDPK